MNITHCTFISIEGKRLGIIQYSFALETLNKIEFKGLYRHIYMHIHTHPDR
jgi:hypothetical protein